MRRLRRPSRRTGQATYATLAQALGDQLVPCLAGGTVEL